MKPQAFYSLFILLLWLLPIDLSGNATAPKSIQNQQVSNVKTPNPWFSQAKTRLFQHNTQYTTRNTQITEGVTESKTRRILKWCFYILAALTIIYLLQGSIWLGVAAAFIGLATNWRRIFPKTEQVVYTYKDNNYTYRNESYYSKNNTFQQNNFVKDNEVSQALKHPSNKNTRRSLIAFVGMLVSALIFAASFPQDLVILGILGFSGLLVSAVLSLIFGIIAVSSKEPRRELAWISLSVAGLLVLLGRGLLLNF